MPAVFTLLDGLPGTRPPSVPCPREWGRLGREGTVVSFQKRDGSTWVGNFQGGIGTETDVRQHPDGKRILVIAKGAIYEVDPEHAEPVPESDCCVTEIWPLRAMN